MKSIYIISGTYSDPFTAVKAIVHTYTHTYAAIYIPSLDKKARVRKTSIKSTSEIKKISMLINNVSLHHDPFTEMECKKRQYLRADSSLTKKQQSYCRCLLHVGKNKNIQSPYAICQNSVNPKQKGVISCIPNYNLEWILNCQKEEFRKMYLSKKYPVWIFPVSLQRKFRYPSRFQKITLKDKLQILVVLRELFKD